ncbi:DNA polymerase/3'-5' exonuclease PolX [Bacillus litorisediminis]|uniref:DNA polymerase/3'-5' exonuclease PolX n=1 Tax=Bacillus litorisediminis TaxID=2922713 RepID=UPI001FAE478E|nr:DNA polymerase/3'-5' exonuclease PolX [Bacillus litorisediminis]
MVKFKLVQVENVFLKVLISMVHKKEIIRLLETIATYMELMGENSFKVAAFRKAANALERDQRSIKELGDYTTIPGIGKGTASVIEEYIELGESALLNELKAKVPAGLIPLLQLQGLGGKKIARLYQELHITNVDELKEALELGKVAKLSGFGQKTEENLLQSIRELKAKPERLPMAAVLPIVDYIEAYLAAIPEIDRFSKAGSLRRAEEMVKDLDFVIATASPGIVKEKLIEMKGIKRIVAKGDTKVSIVVDGDFGLSIDFRLVTQQEFATALHHFTGSKEHNVRMRQIAKECNQKISEYGVEDLENGKVLTFASEQDFYQHFNIPYLPPEVRINGEEIEIFQKEYSFIDIKHIKGDLHMHTTWSDGAHTLEEMVQACIARGYEYMAITDHSQFLKVANGLTKDRLLKQKEEIARLQEKYPDILILAGIEMDILPDGSLDFENDVLEELDFVIASIHSGFQQSKAKIMERLKTALNNVHVNLIAHPTGRKIGTRTGYEIDIEQLIELASSTNTALELNANPNRLDLNFEYVRKARQAGVKICINTDAHYKESLSFMEIGVATARKGWLQPNDCLNAMNKEDLLAFLNIKR